MDDDDDDDDDDGGGGGDDNNGEWNMCHAEAKCSPSDPDRNIIYGSNSKVTITKSKKTWLTSKYTHTHTHTHIYIYIYI